MKETDVAQMNTMREVGIGTGKKFCSFAGQCGGYRYIGFSKKDMYNQIQKQRRIGNGDAKSALQYLKEQSKSDSAMYWRHSVDEEGKLQQLFWVDGCSIFDYSIFGDVLVFDATYDRNKYKFPVVIFSGVNHHKQTTVFAVGIVSNEIEETYVWLLGNFLEAMNGKHPKCVITDGDLSMKNAIKRVFPTAHHRLCVWHICNNAGKNIKKNNFHKDFQKVMYADVEIDDFNMMWEELIAKHGLHNNFWASQIFDCRNMWARSYIREKFYVGWTKKAKDIQGVNFQQCELSRKSVKTSRYGALSDACRVLCNLVCETDEDFSKMLEKFDENVDNVTEDQVRDPVRVRSKGRVPGMTSRPKRGNQCGICREIGHNRASCPNVVGSCSRTFDNNFEEE
ncbi:hypothetical protein Lal_00012532 [Lupinus albus]|nr:hypothetical protein Lal_00012532 [Lupinus albus]